MRMYANRKALTQTGCITFVILVFLICIPFWFTKLYERKPDENLNNNLKQVSIMTQPKDDGRTVNLPPFFTSEEEGPTNNELPKTTEAPKLMEGGDKGKVVTKSDSADTIKEDKDAIKDSEVTKAETLDKEGVADSRGTEKKSENDKVNVNEEGKEKISNENKETEDKNKEITPTDDGKLEEKDKDKPSTKMEQSDDKKETEPSIKIEQSSDSKKGPSTQKDKPIDKENAKSGEQKEDKPSTEKLESESKTQKDPSSINTSSKDQQKEETEMKQTDKADTKPKSENTNAEQTVVVDDKDVMKPSKSAKPEEQQKTKERDTPPDVTGSSDQTKKNAAHADEHMKLAHSDVISQQSDAVVKASKERNVQPVVIPEPEVLQDMDRDQLEDLYHLYLENLQTHCVRQRHIGSLLYGGYHICEDVMRAPPCLMYSFGCKILKDRTFDEGVAKQYGCEVHLFEKKMFQLEIRYSKNVTIHTTSLGAVDDRAHKTLTLKSIKASLGHEQRSIDVLKLDIHSEEWDPLTQLAEGKELEKVKLLIVEFKSCRTDCYDVDDRTKGHFLKYLSLFRRLYEIGFRIYFFRMIPTCAFTVGGVTRIACHDVHMMRQSYD